MPLNYKFTNGDDDYAEFQIYLFSSEKVEALAGNDKIAINNKNSEGIYNAGVIIAGDGNDSILAENLIARSTTSTAIFIKGSISLGLGNDAIKGVVEGGNAGIYLQRDTPAKSLGVIDADSGNDSIFGKSSNTGIQIEGGIITTGDGDDDVTGIGTKSDGIYNMWLYNKSGIWEKGLINLGDGNNVLYGQGHSGIHNAGNIIGGNGRDLITGEASASTVSGYYAGIENSSGITDSKGNLIANTNSILTGAGDDEIIGRGQRGIMNSSVITTGDGNDAIFGDGVLIGLENWAQITTGSGNDRIIGRGINQGIINNGTVDTGEGDDIVDALEGGFFYESDKYEFPREPARGIWNLGSGDDLLIGFGTGSFYGGVGSDSIRLGEGIYTIAGDNVYKKNKWNQNIPMLANGFEWIGGTKGDLQKFSNGSLLIDVNGNIVSGLPFYKVSTSMDNMVEGSRFATTINTSGVVAGSTLYYELSGSGITASDFSTGSLSGEVTIGNTGYASFSHDLAEDRKTEGAERLDIKFFSDSLRTSQVGSTVSIAIGDTSIESTISNKKTDLSGLAVNSSFIGNPAAKALAGTIKALQAGSTNSLDTTGTSAVKTLADLTASKPLIEEARKLLDRYTIKDPEATTSRKASDNEAGFIDFTLKTGALKSLTAEIQLASEVKATAYVKVNPNTGEAFDFTYDPITGLGAELLDTNKNGLVDTLRIHLQDGARGDADGLVNGEIRDPGVLAEAPRASVYRFYRNGVHFYTTSDAERDAVIQKSYGSSVSYSDLSANPQAKDPITGGWGYRFEGIAYQALDTQGTALYRFFSPSKGYHFVTTSSAEALAVIQNSVGTSYDLSNAQGQKLLDKGWGFQFEGNTYKVSTIAQTGMENPVYRFFNGQKGVHFYSSSMEETKAVIANSLGAQYATDDWVTSTASAIKQNPLTSTPTPVAGGWGYSFEGISWYV